MIHEYKKLKALAFGRYGENLAVMSLRLKGYRIVSRNRRTRFGEIDIVASKGITLCFIEVKSRSHLDQALSAVSCAQQKRLLRAAHAFLWAHPCYGDVQIRFDLIAVAPFRWPLHLKNAWGEP